MSSHSPDPPALTGDTVRSATTYIDEWLGFRQRYLRVPGAQVAVLFDGEIVLSKAYGAADLEHGASLTTEHLFRVASHSKTFTATAVMQLAEAGRLRLDDPIGRWLSFLEEAASPLRRVTIRELLAHGGGVVRDGHDSDHWQLLQPFPDEEMLRRIALDAADVLEANEKFKYSNIGYGLLGLVIEAAAGRPYADQVRAEIVDRLGLSNTGPELVIERAEAFAIGYSALAYADERRPIANIPTGALASATGFYSTAEDLCRYASAHFWGDERLLTDASKRVMQHEEWPIEGLKENAYGLGFSIVKAGHRRLVGHGGGFPGHITRLVFDPEARLAVAVLTNCIDGPAEELARGVVGLLDLAAEGSAVPPSVDVATVAPYLGRFANLWGVDDVAALGGRLFLINPTGSDPTESVTALTVEDADMLRVVSGPGYGSTGEAVRFTRDDSGRVISIRGPGGQTAWPLGDYLVQ